MTIIPRPLHLMVLAVALIGFGTGGAFAQQRGGGARPTPKAGFVELESSEVPFALQMTGRAVATNSVAVRPRVNGTITEILYKSGTAVQAGDPLFAIDPLTYEVALAVAEANLARVKADLATTEASFARVDRLRGTTSSEASIEMAAASLAKARASVGESEANLRLAKAQLEWTTVRAPAAGIVDIAKISVGDLVTANQATALTEIVQINPIYVDLTEPYPLRLRVEASAERGELKLIEPNLTLILDDGRRIEGKSKMVSTGAQVSQTTATRTLRFEVENESGLIAPGMFVQAELDLARSTAILVPQRATKRERDGSLSAWVAEGDKSARRKLTERGTYGNSWVVIGGLKEGDKLLIDGIETMRDGQTIELVPAQIDDMGVVRDAATPNVGN